jgi:hypothetical protein
MRVPVTDAIEFVQVVLVVEGIIIVQALPEVATMAWDVLKSALHSHFQRWRCVKPLCLAKLRRSASLLYREIKMMARCLLLLEGPDR